MCIVTLFVIITPLAIGTEYTDAETDDTVEPTEHESDLDDIIFEMQTEILNLQMGMALLWNVIDGGPLDEEVVRLQAAQATAVERHTFLSEYYNACAILSMNDLLKHRIILTERQLEVELVRLTHGETTQGHIDVINAQLTGLYHQLEIGDELLQIKKQLIDAKRGLPGYEFIGDYSIPTPPSPTAWSLSALKSSFINNNTSIYEYDLQIERFNEWLEELISIGEDAEVLDVIRENIDTLCAQRESLSNQLEMTATNKWFSYLDAKVQYDLAEAMRPSLIAQLELIVIMYSLGEISTVERLGLELEVYEELQRVDMAALALAIAVAELDLILEGIVV